MSETKRRRIKTVDDINLIVTLTEGYQDRFTIACLNALKRMEAKGQLGMLESVESPQ